MTNAKQYTVTNEKYSADAVTGTIESLQEDFDWLAENSTDSDWAGIELADSNGTLLDIGNGEIVGQATE